MVQRKTIWWWIPFCLWYFDSVSDEYWPSLFLSYLDTLIMTNSWIHVKIFASKLANNHFCDFIQCGEINTCDFTGNMRLILKNLILKKFGSSNNVVVIFLPKY